MESTLNQAREHFIQGMSRISSFWGYPRAMGAIYGALYLSRDELSLDDLARQANISKGAVSTNVRSLERLGMVQKEIRLGERRDFYVAETDFWQVVKNVLRERQRSEFDHAIRTVSESLEMTKSAQGDQPLDVEKAAFYQARMREMERFFNTLDNLVVTVLALDELRAGSLERLLGGRREKGP